MGQYLFGNRMSNFDLFAISAVTFNMGRDYLTMWQGLGIALTIAVLSTIFAIMFADPENS